MAAQVTLRYRLAAKTLQAFSCNALTRRSYRAIANAIGGRSRAKRIPAHYIERADRNLRFVEANGAIADGQTVLELGTGWVHWESIFTRLFYDVEIVMFDVWDNRQFDAFCTYVRQLRDNLSLLDHRGEAALARAAALASQVLDCSSFAEVYRLLGLRHVIHPDGRLDAVAAHSIDLVISSDVMEHIPVEAMPQLAADLHRIVKPGGYVSQQIVEADHLRIYDRSVHSKIYLQFSESEWQRSFANDVQYINRWQHSDFVKFFEQQGFEIVAHRPVTLVDIADLDIAERWRDYDADDLAITVSRLLLRNPA